ncbi:MAG: hypothetical protein DSY55_01210, partial [Clostridia bacterium]
MRATEKLTPYTLSLAGVTRSLPRVEIAPGVVIAILNILGDTELTEAVAQANLTIDGDLHFNFATDASISFDSVNVTGNLYNDN